MSVTDLREWPRMVSRKTVMGRERDTREDRPSPSSSETTGSTRVLATL